MSEYVVVVIRVRGRSTNYSYTQRKRASDVLCRYTYSYCIVLCKDPSKLFFYSQTIFYRIHTAIMKIDCNKVKSKKSKNIPFIQGFFFRNGEYNCFFFIYFRSGLIIIYFYTGLHNKMGSSTKNLLLLYYMFR